MRVWIIWPQAPSAKLLALVESSGGTVVHVDDLLDHAEERFTSMDADLILISSMTQGSQEVSDWIVQQRFNYQEVRWVVACPSMTDHPEITPWLHQWLNAGVYDWVFEGEHFARDLQDRLARPLSWHDAASVLGGPQAMPTWASLRHPPRTAVGTRVATPESSPLEPLRREVVVVSPAKPIVVAVVGITAGTGTSCVVAGVAEYLEALGQHTMIVEPPQATTSTHQDWEPALRAAVSSGEPRWTDLRAQRKWSYFVMDCHLQWGSVPVETDLLLVVGPGQPHRWGRWTDWHKALRERRRLMGIANMLYLVSPGPHADAIAARLRVIEEVGARPVLCAPDILQESPSDVWEQVLGSILPQIDPRQPRSASVWTKFLGKHSRRLFSKQQAHIPN